MSTSKNNWVGVAVNFAIILKKTYDADDANFTHL